MSEDVDQLKNSISSQAREQGHNLNWGLRSGGSGIWDGECSRCGYGAVINGDQAKTDPQLSSCCPAEPFAMR